jgi:hypothetical protein
MSHKELVSIVLAALTMLSGLIAAFYWVKASRVFVAPMEIIAGKLTPLDPDKDPIPWIKATTKTVIKSSQLNKTAAYWTAGAVVLGAAASLAGLWPDQTAVSADATAKIGNLIALLNAAFTFGILVAAVAALGTWRAQLVGGKRVELAEQCLDAMNDFRFRINVLRMEQTNRKKQIAELREVLLEFQRIFRRLNYYMPVPVGNSIPEALLEGFAILDTNFRTLERYEFKEPQPQGGDSVYAASANAQERQSYQHANNVFYGLCPHNDQVALKLDAATAQLSDILRPILKPEKGWLRKVIGRLVSAF